MKKAVIISIIMIFALSGCSLMDTVGTNNNTYKPHPEALKSLEIGFIEIDMKGFEEDIDGSLIQYLESNEKTGTINAVLSEGWEISEIKYYLDNDTNMKIDGNYTIVGFDSQSELEATKIALSDKLELAKCRTNLFIKLENKEKDEKAKFIVSISKYDYLVVDWGDMKPEKTKFVFNMDYNEGGEILNDDFVMTYVEDEDEMDVSRFSDKDEFVSDYIMYCTIQSPEDKLEYIDEGERIIIRIPVDSGLRSVKVVNPGKNTDIKLIKNATDEEIIN